MARKRDRSPEELARREKIRELLQLANVSSIDDIHELFKETIGEFMENEGRNLSSKTMQLLGTTCADTSINTDIIMPKKRF